MAQNLTELNNELSFESIIQKSPSEKVLKLFLRRKKRLKTSFFIFAGIITLLELSMLISFFCYPNANQWLCLVFIIITFVFLEFLSRWDIQNKRNNSILITTIEESYPELTNEDIYNKCKKKANRAIIDIFHTIQVEKLRSFCIEKYSSWDQQSIALVYLYTNNQNRPLISPTKKVLVFFVTYIIYKFFDICINQAAKSIAFIMLLILIGVATFEFFEKYKLHFLKRNQNNYFYIKQTLEQAIKEGPFTCQTPPSKEETN